MARLINNIADLKRHIVVSATFDFNKVLPYSKRAERKIIINLIGRDQYDTIIAHTLVPDNDAPINLVKELLEEAAAHYALLLAMPTINLLITNSGTKTTDNVGAANADWKEKRDLNRTLIQTYTEALDDAFQIMEDNVDDFAEWRDSQHYTVFKNLIVPQTNIFNEYFTIQKSRQTFFALHPLIREVESQYYLALLGQATLDFIKIKSTDPIVIAAQELAHKGAVALTVSKAVDTSSFVFTESSLSVSLEEMPWEKVSSLSDEKLGKLQAARQKAGEQYLKDLKKIVVANPTIFTAYTDRTEIGLANKIIKKKSGLYL